MRRISLLLVATAVLAIAGCNGEQGKQQFDTAQFEEKQNNREHAIQLYEEIVRKYPDSPLAAKARERITALKGSK